MRSIDNKIRKVRSFLYKYIYVMSGKKPWSKGYSQYKWAFIKQVLSDKKFVNSFKENKPIFPEQYGYGLDERVVEYPWVLSKIDDSPEVILDIGSTFNFEEILSLDLLGRKKLYILTLFPEHARFNRLIPGGVSYVNEDSRTTSFKDEYFDKILCISTLEHIGMDNCIYGEKEPPQFIQPDFKNAIIESKRVLKRNGNLFITVPYGRFMNLGFAIQFNEKLVNEIISQFSPTDFSKTYFKYTKKGWTLSTKEKCKDVVSYDIHKSKWKSKRYKLEYPPEDFAAGARAVCCLILKK